MDLHVYRNSQDRWYDLRAAARSRGAVLATNAVTLDELVERFTPDLKPASPAQQLVLVGRAASADNSPPVSRHALETLNELKAARVRPSELRRAGAETLAAILDAYNNLLGHSGLTDPQDRRWMAANRVAEGHPWTKQFDSIVVHAIYDLTDAEFALLHNLIDRAPEGGTVLLFNTTSNIKATRFAEWSLRRFVQDDALADKTFPEFFRPSGPSKELLERLFVFDAPEDAIPLRPTDSLQILQCPGRYREIESIGSSIADLLSAGADANEIAVVVRHIETYGEMIGDVFTRYAIPHAFETGVPLLRIPFIKYWIAFLDLACSERPRDAMARILASAYYEPRLTPAMDVERILASIGYIDRRHLKASALAARRASPLTAELERLELFLDKLETSSGLIRSFLSQLQPSATALTERDRHAWRTLSEELEAADSLAGDVTFAQFRKLATDIAALRTADRFSARIAPPGVPRVRVTAPRALGYCTYRWIFAPGFADGEIPASISKNPWMPDATIEAINEIIRPRRILTSRDRSRREPLYLFMLLDSARDRLTATFPGSTLEGEPMASSIYVGEIARHYDPSPVIRVDREVQPREIGEFRRRVAREWRTDRIETAHAERLLGLDIINRSQWESRGFMRADLGSGVLPTDGLWNPSELNDLAACPFVFLARRRLKLRSVDLPDFEVPPFEVGNLAHRILREFYSQPIPDSDAAALTRMQDVIQRQLAPVDVDGQAPSLVIDPSLWRIRRPQLVRALTEYVKFAVADARDGYETLLEYLDQPLPSAPLGEIMLGGRPDHVAVRRSGDMLTGIRVDDFKYSAASSGTSKQLQQSFQIPIYAHLAATALHAGPGVPIEGRYLLLRSPSTPVVAHSFDGEVIAEISARVRELMERVRSGNLHPEPADKQACTSCDYRRLCRLYG